ncbi:MAG: hypothetical protein Q8L78_07570 [Coxiellaceae bacterium]|nr:hypothetical protein [Coxiellaceae bacterium]
MRPEERAALTPLRNKIFNQHDRKLKIDGIEAFREAEIMISGMRADEFDRKPVIARLARLSEDEINRVNVLFLERLIAAQAVNDIHNAIQERLNTIALIADKNEHLVLEDCGKLFSDAEKIAEEKTTADRESRYISVAESFVLTAINDALQVRSQELIAQEKQEKIAEKEERKKSMAIEQQLRDKQNKIKRAAGFQSRAITQYRKIKSAYAQYHEQLTYLVLVLNKYYRVTRGDSPSIHKVVLERAYLNILNISARHLSEHSTEEMRHLPFLVYSFSSMMEQIQAIFFGLNKKTTFPDIDEILKAFSLAEPLILPLPKNMESFFLVLASIYSAESAYLNGVVLEKCRKVVLGIDFNYWILRQQVIALVTTLFEFIFKGEVIQETIFLKKLFQDIDDQLTITIKCTEENGEAVTLAEMTEIRNEFRAKIKMLALSESENAVVSPFVTQFRGTLFPIETVKDKMPNGLQRKGEKLVSHIVNLCQSEVFIAVNRPILVLNEYELQYKTIEGLVGKRNILNPIAILQTYETLCNQVIDARPDRKILMSMILQYAIYSREMYYIHAQYFPRIGNSGLIFNHPDANDTIDLNILLNFFRRIITKEVVIDAKDFLADNLLSEKQHYLLKAGFNVYTALLSYDIGITLGRYVAIPDWNLLKNNISDALLIMMNGLLQCAFSLETISCDILRDQCMDVCKKLTSLSVLIASHDKAFSPRCANILNINSFKDNVKHVLDEFVETTTYRPPINLLN